MPGSGLVPRSRVGAWVRAGAWVRDGQAHGLEDVGSRADQGPAGPGTPTGAGLPDPLEPLGPFPRCSRRALQGWVGGEDRLRPC